MIAIPNRVRVVAVIAALALAGGLLTLALLAKPTQAQVQTEHYTEQIPFFSGLGVACLGEDISTEGTSNVAFTLTQHEDGSRQLRSHTNVMATGVGDESGDEYIIREVNNYRDYVENWDDPSSQQNFTQMYTLRVMRKGSATPEDDFLVRYLVHITVDANMEVTATVDKGIEECQ